MTPVEIEARIAGLKTIAAFTPKPIERQWCLEEILRARAAQLQALMRQPLSPESTGVIDTLPALTSLGQAGDLFEVPAPS